MITTLLSTTNKAIKRVYSPTSKLPKNFRTLPVLSHFLLSCENGKIKVSSAIFNEKTQNLEILADYIPARIDTEFSICVPAKQFKDWVNASQLDKHERATNTSEQMTFSVKSFEYNRSIRHTLEIRAGNTKVTFVCLSADEFPAMCSESYPKGNNALL